MDQPAIFIVEDEAIVANDIRETLKSLGYSVSGIAKSGELALEKIKETHPDLVLMDIHLAGTMDGIETAGTIHTKYGIPIIFLTAFTDSVLLERAKVTEPYGYIVKPYDERGLHSAIRMALYKYGIDKKLKENENRLRVLNEELETRVAARTASLRQQLEFLQQLINTIPAPIYYKNSRGEYLGCNNAFETYTGIPKPGIVGKTDAALFPSNMSVLSAEKDSQLMSRRGIQVYQTRFPHADHLYRDVIIKKATFNNPEGGIAGFIGVMIDITDRIHADKALRESEGKFRAISEDLTELIWRSSPDRTCTFANPAFLRYFGRIAENTIGYLFTPTIHPDDIAKVRTDLTTLSPDHPAVPFSFRVILPDGAIRTLQGITRAFFDSNGQIMEYQSVGHETD